MKEIEASVDVFIKKLEEELKDVELFGPLPKREDCPICFLPIPLEARGVVSLTCCGKRACNGCMHQQMLVSGSISTDQCRYCCPFCRTVHRGDDDALRDYDSILEKTKRRIEDANDTNAMITLAECYDNSFHGLEKDDVASLGLWLRAAMEGNAVAIGKLATEYQEEGRLTTDTIRGMRLTKVAAKRGMLSAHFNLGVFYSNKEYNVKMMVKHFSHAAKGGHKNSMQNCKLLRDNGEINEDEYNKIKQEFAERIRSEWSEERQKAEEYYQLGAGLRR